MTEQKQETEAKMVNELSTTAKSIFMTPESASKSKARKRDIEDQEAGCEALNFFSPGPSGQGDRFIPRRGSAVSKQLFNMPENVLASPADLSNTNEREQNSLIFENLLEQKLLKLTYDEVLEGSRLSFDGYPGPLHSDAKTTSNPLNPNQGTPVKKQVDSHFLVKRSKLLSFSDKKEDRMDEGREEEPSGMDSRVIKRIKTMRKIQKTPYRVLDAPELSDDFYRVTLPFRPALSFYSA
jgi:hypothetical protein